MRRYTHILWILVISVSASRADAQLVKNPFGKKDAPKESPKDAKIDETSSEEFYLDMRDFAEGLYNKQAGEGDKRRDSDFKRRVDTEYESLRRANAQRAYEVNRSARSEIAYVIEDRYRVFSGLYDNLLVQDLLNRTGQSIIPKTNQRLYAFKLIADPIPRAETLSTGTIYITTGLVALLDTKAQLAYVLAHEAAHIYRGHFKTEIMINLATAEYAAQKQADREAVLRKWAMVSALGGGMAGALAGRSGDATLAGALAGGAIGAFAAAVVQRPGPMFTDWNRVQEDEADQTALEWVLAANQNVEEIPKVFQVLKEAGDRDDRVTLGFLGRSNRVRERLRKIEELVNIEKNKPSFPRGPFSGSDGDFDQLMAEVKRDNGVLAFQYDMLETARDNLQKSVAIKRTDPTALYFYAKILKETARTDEERAKSLEYFRLAEENDQRNLNYGAHLHRAVALLKTDATTPEKTLAVDLLKKYLEDYYLSAIEASQVRAAYPPHVETIYDYMSRLGEYRYVLDGEKVRQEAAAAKVKTLGIIGTSDRISLKPAAEPVQGGQTPKPPPAKKTK